MRPLLRRFAAFSSAFCAALFTLPAMAANPPITSIPFFPGTTSAPLVSSAPMALAPQVSAAAVAPAIDPMFTYSLTDISKLPLLGKGDVVALTQGTSSVNNGRMSYTIPIRLPPTVNDLKPDLALSYSSQNNTNGLMGVGWSLSAGGAISRCAKNYATEGALAQVPNPNPTSCIQTK